MSYFGRAKFKEFFNKECIRYLAPKLYAHNEEVTPQELKKTY
jgi:hypothetical protein